VPLTPHPPFLLPQLLHLCRTHPRSVGPSPLPLHRPETAIYLYSASNSGPRYMNHQHFMRPFLRRALTWAFAENKRRQVSCSGIAGPLQLIVAQQAHAAVAAGENGPQLMAGAADASAL
jgi:hypothetical protein